MVAKVTGDATLKSRKGSIFTGFWYHKAMNVLFICQANVGRSQAAMELYRQKGGKADSSGTKVDAPGASLAERPGAANIIHIMRSEHGVDMFNNVRTQLTPENAQGYDKIVVMAEKETWPEWLARDSRVEHWLIDDPKGQDYVTTQRVVREVEARVSKLPVGEL